MYRIIKPSVFQTCDLLALEGIEFVRMLFSDLVECVAKNPLRDEHACWLRVLRAGAAKSSTRPVSIPPDRWKAKSVIILQDDTSPKLPRCLSAGNGFSSVLGFRVILEMNQYVLLMLQSAFFHDLNHHFPMINLSLFTTSKPFVYSGHHSSHPIHGLADLQAITAYCQTFGIQNRKRQGFIKTAKCLAVTPCVFLHQLLGGELPGKSR